jgi:hypothetical protein
VFGLAAVGGLLLGGKHDDTLHVGVATFFVVTNLLTTAFLLYFAARVWQVGARSQAVWAGVVTLAAAGIAITYDFFPWSFDDAERTYFYTAALTTWGAQAVAYFYAYRALDEHNRVADERPMHRVGAE